MLSARLKELRTKKGNTQDDMADLLQIKRQTYSAYERGVSMPDIPSLVKLAAYFNVTVDDLLGIDNDNLSAKQKAALQMSEQLSDEQLKKVIDYADLIMKAENQ